MDRKQKLILSLFDHRFFFLCTVHVVTPSVNNPEGSRLIFGHSYLPIVYQLFWHVILKHSGVRANLIKPIENGIMSVFYM